MPKFLAVGSYSVGTWARLTRCGDDRVSCSRKFAESLGATIDCMYWEIGTRSVYAIVDAPDSATIAAVAMTLAQSGAFTSVDVHELLTQEQLSEVLLVARGAAKVYQVPGQPAERVL
jgi:uncharacterized protein with GYD domain